MQYGTHQGQSFEPPASLMPIFNLLSRLATQDWITICSNMNIVSSHTCMEYLESLNHFGFNGNQDIISSCWGHFQYVWTDLFSNYDSPNCWPDGMLWFTLWLSSIYVFTTFPIHSLLALKLSILQLHPLWYQTEQYSHWTPHKTMCCS